MKLTGILKKSVTKAQTKEEEKEIIKDTIKEGRMVFDDEELDKVSGGGSFLMIYDDDTRLK